LSILYRGKYTTATKTLRAAEQEHLLQHFPVVIEEKYRIRTSGYAMWFTAVGAIHIAHYDVIDDLITRKI